jgi:hypothetical protein
MLPDYLTQTKGQPMRALRLSDESMDLLFRLAAPLAPDDRGLFLERVAQE